MKQIHWFPGHMKKALAQIQESLKWVDVIVEVVDARAINSSRYPMLLEKNQKKTILVISKIDLADSTKTQKWLDYFHQQHQAVLKLNLNESNAVPSLIRAIEKEMKPLIDKYAQKGLKNKTVKIMILGIPNVGKSTLINRLAKKNKTLVENRPGVTRGQQWIHASNHLLVLDTPGILPPHYDSLIQAKHLALIGSMKIEHMPLEELALYLYEFLTTHYPKSLSKHYGLDTNTSSSFFEALARRRGWFSQTGVDLDRAYQLVIKDFSDGKISGVSLETQSL